MHFLGVLGKGNCKRDGLLNTYMVKSEENTELRAEIKRTQGNLKMQKENWSQSRAVKDKQEMQF